MNEIHKAAIPTLSQTTILSRQALPYRETEIIDCSDPWVAEDANYRLRHLYQAEILALKLFFQSINTKKELGELLKEFKNKSVISEDFFYKLCRLLSKKGFTKENLSTLISQEISGGRRFPCGLQYIIYVIDQWGKMNLANELVIFCQNLNMHVIPRNVQKVSASRRKRIQISFKSMKKMIQDMMFKDPIEYFRNLSVKILGKMNSMCHIHNKRNMTELCDKYIASLTLTMDSIATKSNAIDPNDELFQNIDSMLTMTSCPDLYRCMLYGRRAVALAFANKKTEGDDMIKEALVCASRVSDCLEKVDTLYKIIIYLRAWYEFFPQIITNEIYELFTQAIYILENEPDDIRLFWTRRFTLRLLFCYLGLGMRCRFIKHYNCSYTVRKESERLIQTYDSSDAELRVQMYFAIAKSRLYHLKGDIDQALEYIQLAKEIATNVKFCELEIILETEKILFLGYIVPLFVEDESGDSENVLSGGIPKNIQLPNSLYRSNDLYVELTNSVSPPLPAPVSSGGGGLNKMSENAGIDEWEINTNEELITLLNGRPLVLSSIVYPLKVMMSQFSSRWFSWVAFLHKFTSSTKTNLERANFLIATKSDAFTKSHPHEEAKTQNSRKLASRIYMIP